jgi:hypothetical protein
MTLIIAALADDGIVQASDRLLTLGDRPVEKPENKSVCVACRDANFTLASTGVALVQGRPTADWVLDEDVHRVGIDAECESVRTRIDSTTVIAYVITYR